MLYITTGQGTKKCGAAVYHTDNRHRQAPCTHMDKQAVRTIEVCEPRCLFIPCTISIKLKQNWRFCCLGILRFTFSIFSFMVLRPYPTKLIFICIPATVRTALFHPAVNAQNKTSPPQKLCRGDYK